jgi:hypothetical protein
MEINSEQITKTKWVQIFFVIIILLQQTVVGCATDSRLRLLCVPQYAAQLKNKLSDSLSLTVEWTLAPGAWIAQRIRLGGGWDAAIIITSDSSQAGKCLLTDSLRFWSVDTTNTDQILALPPADDPLFIVAKKLYPPLNIKQIRYPNLSTELVAYLRSGIATAAPLLDGDTLKIKRLFPAAKPITTALPVYYQLIISPQVRDSTLIDRLSQ